MGEGRVSQLGVLESPRHTCGVKVPRFWVRWWIEVVHLGVCHTHPGFPGKKRGKKQN